MLGYASRSYSPPPKLPRSYAVRSDTWTPWCGGDSSRWCGWAAGESSDGRRSERRLNGSRPESLCPYVKNSRYETNTDMKSKLTPSAEIHTLHNQVVHAADTAKAAAIRIGQLLTEMKSALPHGQYLPWVRQNCPFAERTAQRYTSVFENQAKYDTVSLLSDVYKAISEPKEAQSPAHAPATDPDPDPDEEPEPQRIRQAQTDQKATAVADPQVGPPPPPRKKTPVDKVGRVIPEKLLELWKREEEVRVHLAAISRIRGAIRKADEEKDLLYREPNLSRIEAQLANAYSELKRAIPFAVCPGCQGQVADTCRLCKGRGFISEFTWDTAIPNETKDRIIKASKKSEK